MSAPRRVIVLFTKWPRAGRGKRRVARAVGTRPALSLARAFLRDTLALAARAGADRLLIAFTPPSARAPLARLADGAVLVEQARGSFGTRLRRALEAGLAAGDRALVIGMDAPTLPPSRLRKAFRCLDGATCVLGPAADGGYYLIGSRAPLPPTLFRGMPWSSSRVMAETLRRAMAAGVDVALLPEWYDVDDAEGLERLRHDRAGLARARATRAALAALGPR